jgi:hypothetical protein
MRSSIQLGFPPRESRLFPMGHPKPRRAVWKHNLAESADWKHNLAESTNPPAVRDASLYQGAGAQRRFRTSG